MLASPIIGLKRPKYPNSWGYPVKAPEMHSPMPAVQKNAHRLCLIVWHTLRHLCLQADVSAAL
eukprot:scaffold157268_cov19-Prasinocladus_malaysianus.AAC.1